MTVKTISGLAIASVKKTSSVLKASMKKISGLALPSSDPVLGYTTNLVLRWRASDLTLNNNDLVASWASTGSNPIALTQTTDTNKPTFKTGIIGTRAAVMFDGNDNRMSTTDVDIANPVTYFMVIKYIANPSGQDTLMSTYAGGNGYGNALLHSSGTDGVFLYNGGQLSSNVNITDTNAYYLMGTFNQTSSLIRKNGSTIKTGSTGNVACDGGFWLACKGSNQTEHSNIYIAEVLVYSEAVSAINYATVESYLHDYYGFA